ncbi:MAG: phage NrS-1 polymerase family protein [Ktedonobacteraceae bacterium]
MSETTTKYDVIPEDMKCKKQWVLWRLEKVEGKLTKVPYHITSWGSQKASSINPNTWNTFDEIIQHADKFNGIGYVFNEDLTGIDLDHCVKDGVIDEWALEIIKKLDSYTEFSPSGNGVHIYVKGEYPNGHKKKIPNEQEDAAIEIYSKGRYFTVTGSAVPGCSTEINERQEIIDLLHIKYFKPMTPMDKPEPTSRTTCELSDNEIINLLSHAKNRDKFQALMSGDTSEYSNDDSSADMALCHLFAFYTDDFDQIDRLFRDVKVCQKLCALLAELITPSHPASQT